MIAGIFHKGSGLGDQLMRYITVRTLAEEKGFEWGMIDKDLFKGNFFMNFDLGKDYNWDVLDVWKEKDVRDSEGNDIRSYDPEINFIEDRTVIDGCFEDYKYWGHNLDNIRNWLKVEPLPLPSDVCVIGFRGGEYYSDRNLGLPIDYYNEAIALMRSKYPGITFEIHTDDPIKAKEFFPGFECIQNISINWRSVRYAKHLIIANSAFYIMPALLNENLKEIIAPRFWARRNTKTWARPACYYKKFTYI